jgi:hypothetical protein
MNSIRIEILNPKALKLLQSLVDLNLISLNDSKEDEFKSLLNKIRKKNLPKIDLIEITNEVEAVRLKNYEKKAKKSNS